MITNDNQKPVTTKKLMIRWNTIMARKAIDPSLLKGLVQGASTQEVTRGVPRTTDPNFPVFSTPVNEDVIVYFPKVNFTSDETGEHMGLLESYLHSAKKGKGFTSVRCINNLAGGAFEQIGYDGTCPACEAMGDVWDLYNLKMKHEAKVMNIDIDDDPNDLLKPARQKVREEMDLQNSEKYVTFPIVIIPTKAAYEPTDDAMDTLRVEFVTWREKRYNDAIGEGLKTMIDNPGHPAGMFWFWKFSYNTEGKPASARDSAKNAKYTPITDGKALERFNKFIPKAEEKAKDFTLLKAAEVVVAVQFHEKADVVAEVDQIMAKTRRNLDVAKMEGGDLALPAGQTGGQIAGGANPLASFGTAQQGGALGVADGGQGANPLDQTVGAGITNPVTFGTN